jgi:transposase
MIRDQQVRLLMSGIRKGKSIAAAGARAGMGESSARKYRRLGKLPGECKREHNWRTREDPFSGVWEEVRADLVVSPGLQANTLFEDLQRRYPGEFEDGQLRTLQRRVRTWRATEGPEKEVFFAQQHVPGVLCESDYCRMGQLGITVAGQAFTHMLYHFVLTYSNWEDVSICFGESAESMSEGLQNALWRLGGVPQRHRTDSLSAAVSRPGSKEEFTRSYQALMDHCGLEFEHTQPGRPNENGDVEQRHCRLRQQMEQALLLRGSRDFRDRQDYIDFLRREVEQANKGRKERLEEERKLLKPLPARRLDACKKLKARVGPSSTIRAKHNVYSVPSRLIGEEVEVRVFAQTVEVWYGQRRVDSFPRLIGEGGHRINYRHVIGWLVRKPGAFENYRYRDDMFPSSRFRMAYDVLSPGVSVSGQGSATGAAGTKEYLKILELAATQTEEGVDEALRVLLGEYFADERVLPSVCSPANSVPARPTPMTRAPITAERVRETLLRCENMAPPTQIAIDDVDLSLYDALLEQSVGATAGDTCTHGRVWQSVQRPPYTVEQEASHVQ